MSGYDVTDRAALDAVLDELDARIGLDRLRALHVNDAKSPLGSNSDRHENILDGLMGESSASSSAIRASRGCRPCWRSRHGRQGAGRGAGHSTEGAAWALGNHVSGVFVKSCGAR